MENDFLEERRRQTLRREGFLLLLVALFVLANALALSVVQADGYWNHFWGPLAWVGIIAISFLVLLRFAPQSDSFLLIIFALLTGWGILLVDRLADNFLPRQVLWTAIGAATFLVITLVPKNLQPLRRYRYTWLVAGLVLLGATFLFGVNPSGNGLALWLPVPIPFVGPAYFQPSELLKLLLVIFLASYFAEREPLLRLGHSRGILGALPYTAPLLFMWGFCMVLLVWQRDLGAAMLFFLVFLALLHLATGEWRYALLGILLLLLGAAIAAVAFDVVALRIEAWWDPWPQALDRSFQIVQSLYALAAGGVLGQGIGQGFPTFIPVVHSDFVFAAVAEEWGLIGGLVVICCFLILTQRGFRLALATSRPFRAYLAAGITVLFAIQALMIMAGVTKVLPLTGVTLPFISYGGSSLLVSSAMLGLLAFISAETMTENG